MWPQWIILRQLDRFSDVEKHDVIILDVKSENEYGNYYQIIKYITDAYDNKEMLYSNAKLIGNNESNYLSSLNLFIRGGIQGAAASIIHVSKGCIIPVSFYEYELFFKEMKSKNLTYEITISSQKNDNGGCFNWDITLNNLPYIINYTGFDSITKTVNQLESYISIFIAKTSFGVSGFQRYDYRFENVKQKIKESIFFEEISYKLLNEIYDNCGVCPCDICAVRSACIQFSILSWKQKYRRITDQCQESENYNDLCLNYLNNKKIDQDLINFPYYHKPFVNT
jgi:hypothetical protein